MSTPYRFEIHLRLGQDGSTECKLDPRNDDPAPGWRRIDLSRETIYNSESMRTFERLLDDLRHGVDAEAVKENLPYELQQRIGHRLFAALFGPGASAFGDRRIHIVPEWGEATGPEEERRRDAFLDLVLALPWSLLTESDELNAPFLALRSHKPVAITVEAAPRRGGEPMFGEVTLPLHPNLLLICTDTKRKEPTDATEHVKALRDRLLFLGRFPDDEDLAGYDKNDLANPGSAFYARDKGRLRFARTFEQVREQLVRNRFRPHVIYFFGHAGVGADDGTALDFETRHGEHKSHALDDLVPLIAPDHQRQPEFPPIVWINACRSGVGRRSALRRLAPYASAVLATRAVIGTDVGSRLGALTLERIVQGDAPPLALRDSVCELALDMTSEFVAPAWWMVTVMAVQYRLWNALHPEARKFDDAETAGDLPGRLDRTVPLRQTRNWIHKRLTPAREGSVALAILWHGTAEDGLIAFGRRLEDHLAEEYPSREPRCYQVDLQPDAWTTKGNGHFFVSLDRAFQRQGRKTWITDTKPSDIHAKLRQLAKDGPGFVILNHGMFTAPHAPLLDAYLAFWRAQLEQLKRIGTEVESLRLLLCFGFDAPEVPEVLQSSKLPLYAMRLSLVSRREIAAHVEDFERFYVLRESNPKAEAERLVEDSKGGRFRLLYDELQQMLSVTFHDKDYI